MKKSNQSSSAPVKCFYLTVIFFKNCVFQFVEEKYFYYKHFMFPITCRVACPNFRNPAQISSFTKYKFLQVNIFLKLFQLWNGDLLYS